MTTSATPFDRTEIPFELPFPRIRLKETGCAAGSCFADRVFGALLHASAVRGMSNPNGIAYNPFSIQESLRRLEAEYTESDFFEFNGLWHSWIHHGSFSMPTRAEALEKAETARKEFRKTLKKATFFFMTLSSAYVYIHNRTDRIVANCHKVPSGEFRRELLSHDTCRAAIVSACRCIREYSPDCRIFLTVSPVLHDPGDLRKNFLSKGRLLSAAADALESIPGACCFPAYEIVAGELRDYRYYGDDLIHPSEKAAEIVLSRFLETCCEPEVSAWYAEAQRRAKAAGHQERRT